MTALNTQAKAKLANPIFTDADLGTYNSIFRLIVFSLADFFEWWYIQMPILYISKLRRIAEVLNDQLSVSLLLKTFFIPWHRDYKPVGYFMGSSMRLLYLPIATTLYLLTITLYITFIFLWILLPILTLIFLMFTPLIK